MAAFTRDEPADDATQERWQAAMRLDWDAIDDGEATRFTFSYPGTDSSDVDAVWVPLSGAQVSRLFRGEMLTFVVPSTPAAGSARIRVSLKRCKNGIEDAHDPREGQGSFR